MISAIRNEACSSASLAPVEEHMLCKIAKFALKFFLTLTLIVPLAIGIYEEFFRHKQVENLHQGQASLLVRILRLPVTGMWAVWGYRNATFESMPAGDARTLSLEELSSGQLTTLASRKEIVQAFDSEQIIYLLKHDSIKKDVLCDMLTTQQFRGLGEQLINHYNLNKMIPNKYLVKIIRSLSNYKEIGTLISHVLFANDALGSGSSDALLDSLLEELSSDQWNTIFEDHPWRLLNDIKKLEAPSIVNIIKKLNQNGAEKLLAELLSDNLLIKDRLFFDKNFIQCLSVKCIVKIFSHYSFDSVEHAKIFKLLSISQLESCNEEAFITIGKCISHYLNCFINDPSSDVELEVDAIRKKFTHFQEGCFLSYIEKVGLEHSIFRFLSDKTLKSLDFSKINFVHSSGSYYFPFSEDAETWLENFIDSSPSMFRKKSGEYRTNYYTNNLIQLQKKLSDEQLGVLYVVSDRPKDLFKKIIGVVNFTSFDQRHSNKSYQKKGPENRSSGTNSNFDEDFFSKFFSSSFGSGPNFDPSSGKYNSGPLFSTPKNQATEEDYKTLGLKKGALWADVKAKYRKRALQVHPDRNRGDKAADAAFQDLSNAYGHIKSDLAPNEK